MEYYVAYHAIAVLAGGRQKSIVNKTEDQILSNVVIPFVSTGVVQAAWGKTTQSYQVLELRIYKTDRSWDKKSTVPLDQFIGSAQNRFKHFEKKANALLSKSKYRVFVIMPIQGEKFGSQDEQRIYREYDERFEVIESLLSKHKCVAIRIDKEHPIQDLVARIKEEIKKSQFVVADLTDERPSCYFEAGYAEALKRPVIYIASKESVAKPGQKTKIHFDIHMNVNHFTNSRELRAKLEQSIQKNRDLLFLEKNGLEPITK
jgi:nucleoside 2-deoxyribosyltransferase